MGPLAGRRIVLGVTGGIAAYKAVEVCRRLVDAGAHVAPVLTGGAMRFIGRATFDALASEPVQTSLWDEPHPIPHTRLGQGADLVIVCPAMHTEMWEQPAVQENVEVLAGRGVTIVGPVDGRLAGGDHGAGRMADPSEVVAAAELILGATRGTDGGDLAGLTVLVTAGGTREPICPVRFIGNRSSGRQGHAIALEAASRGAVVHCVTTRPDGLAGAPGLDVVAVETAAEMAEAVGARAAGADVVIMAAAVADFRPATVATDKIKKDAGPPEILLEPTVDILAELGRSRADSQVLVGFAAETSDLRQNAAAKLVAKGIDLMVANDVSAPGVGFDHDTNAVVILDADGGATEVPLAHKREVAAAVLDAVIALHRTNRSTNGDDT